MKKLLVITTLILSACGGIPVHKTAQEVTNGIKCTSDEFTKVNECKSDIIRDPDTEPSTWGALNSNGSMSMYFVKRSNKFLIHGEIGTRAGALVKDEAKVKAEKAFDNNGKQLAIENVKESSADICMQGTCYMSSPFDLVIEKKWLEQNAFNGVSIKVYTNQNSITRTQKIPAHYIKGFLDFINTKN